MLIHSAIWQPCKQVTDFRITHKRRFGHLTIEPEADRVMLPELRELLGIFKNNLRDSLWETAMLKCYEHTSVKKDNLSVAPETFAPSVL